MKNNFFVLALAIIVGFSANCKSVKIPAPVKKAFISKYPDATNIKWGKENAKEYEAAFKLNSANVSANFLGNGNWVETETEISIADLPVAVNTAVTKKYSGAVITMAEKLEMPGDKLLYEVSFKVNGKKKSLELNADGTAAK